jgi:MFS family permease
MPVIRTMGRASGTALRGARSLTRRATVGGRWVARHVRTVRDRGAAGELGMTRLLDLHAASCAGDTLVAIGLAGTIFFAAPVGEARGQVALYLLVTMVPFALLAPVVGPLLDRFRHGRRYALAITMLGRAFLAWLISDYIHGFGLYPAAFGVLALSRAYGVARSAAVPRLLPARLGLSEAGARASVYGTIAGALVAPLGIAVFTIGPQWPLRVASVVFLAGMVVALRLPPRADSDPPEAAPRLLKRSGDKALSGKLVLATVGGSAGLRALYGFLLLFLAFSIKAGDVGTRLLELTLSPQAALGVVGGALGAGTFLSTAIGTRLRIRRPLALQASMLAIVTAIAVLTALWFSLAMIGLLCLAVATASGLAKLAVDACIQERIPEHVRASAFAHAETLLMLAWVAGGAIGLIPLNGHLGVALAAAGTVLATLRAMLVTARLRKERLDGRERRDRESPEESTAPLRPEPARSEPPTVRRATLQLPGPPPSGAQPSGAQPPPPRADLAPPGFSIYRPGAGQPADTSDR